MSEISEEDLNTLEQMYLPNKDWHIQAGQICTLIDEIRRLHAENAGLKPLAKLGVEAIEECAWQGCNFDGEDIQEAAEKYGAIQEAPEGYDPDIHPESDICGPGDRWYTFTPSALAAKSALEDES